MAEWRLKEPCKLPANSYFDDDGFLHSKDGKYLPDGVYITDEGISMRYEMFFNTGRFDLLEK